MSKFMLALDGKGMFTMAINKSMVKKLSIEYPNEVIATMIDGSSYVLFKCNNIRSAENCLQEAICEIENDDSELVIPRYIEEAK